MANLTQLRINIDTLSTGAWSPIGITNQNGQSLLEAPYYVSNTSGGSVNTDYQGTPYTHIPLPSSGMVFDVIINVTSESDVTQVCYDSDIFLGSYGPFYVQVFAVYDDASEELIGAGTMDEDVTPCVSLTYPAPCIISDSLIVGQNYEIRSEDETRSGIIRVTSKDTDGCNLCFYVMSGDWTTIDPSVDYNIKVIYGPNSAIDYCILNPLAAPEPLWVNVISDTYWIYGPDWKFNYSSFDGAWIVDSQMDPTWVATIDTTAAGAPLEGEGVTGVRGTLEQNNGGESLVEVRLISDAGVVDSTQLDLSALGGTGTFEFLFNNPPALGSALSIEVEHLTNVAYLGAITLSNLEFLVLPSVQDQL